MGNPSENQKVGETVKNIHMATHPSAKMQKRPSLEWDWSDEQTPSVTPPPEGQAPSAAIIAAKPANAESEVKPWNPFLPSGKTMNHRSPVLNKMRQTTRWSHSDDEPHPEYDDPEAAPSLVAVSSSSEEKNESKENASPLESESDL